MPLDIYSKDEIDSKFLDIQKQIDNLHDLIKPIDPDPVPPPIKLRTIYYNGTAGDELSSPTVHNLDDVHEFSFISNYEGDVAIPNIWDISSSKSITFPSVKLNPGEVFKFKFDKSNLSTLKSGLYELQGFIDDSGGVRSVREKRLIQVNTAVSLPPPVLTPGRVNKDTLKVIDGPIYVSKNSSYNGISNVIVNGNGSQHAVTITDSDVTFGDNFWVHNAAHGPHACAAVLLLDNKNNFTWKSGGIYDARAVAPGLSGRAQGFYGFRNKNLYFGKLVVYNIGIPPIQGQSWAEDPDSEYNQGLYLNETDGLKIDFLAGIHIDNEVLKMSSKVPGGFNNAKIGTIIAIDCQGILSFSISGGRAERGFHKNVHIKTAIGERLGGPLPNYNNFISGWGIRTDGADDTCSIDTVYIGQSAKLSDPNRPPVDNTPKEKNNLGAPKIGKVFSGGWQNPTYPSFWSNLNSAIEQAKKYGVDESFMPDNLPV